MLTSPVLQAVILGIFQGLTEFLPISSSAHLLLLPWVFGWEHMGLTFDVALHLGTLAAVLIYFRKDLWKLSKDLLGSLRPGNPAGEESGARVAWAIVIGTVPALIIGGLFADQIEQTFRHPIVTVVTLSVFGALLLLADRYGAQKRTIPSVTWKAGLLIGCAQAMALVPGVSRSGATITMALLLGLKREDSARFSFLLGSPIVFLAGGKATLDLWQAGGIEPGHEMAFIIGIMVSLVTGILCIKLFLRFLQSRTYLPFAVYRFLLALFIFYLLVR